MPDYNGDFLWYDLMTTDPEGAKAFYTKVIGWGTHGWGDGPAPYATWKVGDSMIGGVMELPEAARNAGAPPHWIGYVGTPDVDASFEKMLSLGGQVYVPPQDIPAIGRFAVFGDPEGAVLAMYQPTNDPEPQKSEPGYIGWHELMTSDLEGALSFYERLFGWNKTRSMDMGDLGPYQMYGRGERSLGGMMKCPPGIPTSAWLYYITVTDIEATLARVSSNGGQVLNGPMPVPGGRVAQCVDPQGAAFAIYQDDAATQ